MLIDIHRHNSDNSEADLLLKNVFHTDTLSTIKESYLSLGLHPWHVNNFTLNSDLAHLRLQANDNRIIAIGEAGLDKSISTSINLQTTAFQTQINLASSLNKPMIIHCVRAYNELIKFRKNSIHKQPWIIHWFNASIEIAMELIRKNCYLSFGLTLFNESSKAHKAFSQIPLKWIFLETDDADLTISQVYSRAAEIRNISTNQLEEQIEYNFFNCFGIRP